MYIINNRICKERKIHLYNKKNLLASFCRDIETNK